MRTANFGDLEDLKAYYARISEDEIFKIASEEAGTLRKEAVAILFAEMQKRQVPEEVFKAFQNQISGPSAETINHYINFVRSLPCPSCKGTSLPLNASVSRIFIGFVIYTEEVDSLSIACPKCLDKEHNSASVLTAVIGWWALPAGLFKPFFAFNFNYQQKKLNHHPQPSSHLIDFVSNHLGKIQINENKPEELAAVLKNAGKFK